MHSWQMRNWNTEAQRLTFKTEDVSPVSADQQKAVSSPGGAVVKNLPACQGRRCRTWGSILRSGRSPGGRSGNPLQYSCLGNAIDREAWRATVHGIAKSQTRLSSHTHTYVQKAVLLEASAGKFQPQKVTIAMVIDHFIWISALRAGAETALVMTEFLHRTSSGPGSHSRSGLFGSYSPAQLFSCRCYHTED